MLTLPRELQNINSKLLVQKDFTVATTNTIWTNGNFYTDEILKRSDFGYTTSKSKLDNSFSVSGCRISLNSE